VIRTLSVLAASVFVIGCAASVAQTALAQTPAPAAPAAVVGAPTPTPSAPVPPAAGAPASGAPGLGPVGPDGLPTGPGHELVMRVCTACHGPEMFMDKKFDRNGWDDVVQMMSGRGAQATPDEFKQITDYLAAALPAA